MMSYWLIGDGRIDIYSLKMIFTGYELSSGLVGYDVIFTRISRMKSFKLAGYLKIFKFVYPWNDR